MNLQDRLADVDSRIKLLAARADNAWETEGNTSTTNAAYAKLDIARQERLAILAEFETVS